MIRGSEVIKLITKIIKTATKIREGEKGKNMKKGGNLRIKERKRGKK